MAVYKKIIVFFLVITFFSSVFLFTAQPVKSAAVVYDPVYYLKEFVIYPIVRKIANSLENKLMNSVNKQISTIGGKSPAFITNWRNHIFDSQARGNDVFRSVLADTKLCSYFDKDIKNAFGADKFVGVLGLASKTGYENKTTVPGTASFQLTANCTLPTGFDVNKFRGNFKNGGWDTWSKLIEPQNNFLGAMQLAQQEQQKQIDVEKQASQDSSVAGQGFLAQKLGTITGLGGMNSAGLGPSGCVALPNAVTLPSLNGPGTVVNNPITRCTFMGKDVTRGEVLGNSAVASIDKKLGRPGSASQLTDILLGLFSAVLNSTTSRIANYIGKATLGSGSTGNGKLDETDIPCKDKDNLGGCTDPTFNPGQIQQQGQQSCLDLCIASEQAKCGSPIDLDYATCNSNASLICQGKCQ